jgi:hypothetical protein
MFCGSFSLVKIVSNPVNERVAILNKNTNQSHLFNDPFYVQQIVNATGYQINLDRFEVNVGLLPIIDGRRLTAAEFLSYIRLHLNDFIDTGITSFVPYNDPSDIVNDTQRWNSSNPLGSLLHLNIADNGSVIVTDYNANHWTVSTIRTPLDGHHPVSGNRMWGYSEDANGYHFFVTGADRLTTPGHDLLILLLKSLLLRQIIYGLAIKINFLNLLRIIKVPLPLDLK